MSDYNELYNDFYQQYLTELTVIEEGIMGRVPKKIKQAVAGTLAAIAMLGAVPDAQAGEYQSEAPNQSISQSQE